MADYPNLNPLLKWLWDILSFYSVEEIKIAKHFRDKVRDVKEVLRSDVSGLVNTVLDFMVNCAVAKYTIETESSELNSIINNWLKTINYDLLGRVPIGIEALSKEYYRERWKSSSLIVLRTKWDTKTINGSDFYLPTKMWFVDGENIEIENPDKNIRIIGKEKYFLKLSEKTKKYLPESDDEKIFVQKPFDSWTEIYSNPFVLQRGLWKNLKFYDLVNKKGEKIVGKAIEYLLLLKKGTEQLALKGSPEFIYSEEDLKKLKEGFKDLIQTSKTQEGTPTYATNFDTEIEHIIPEYSRILSAAIYENIEKRILAGLGLIDIVEGAGSTRRESVLNPKPFITEVEAGIRDFISLLSDVITTIKIENSSKHPKYLNQDIELHAPPVKQFVTDNLRDHFRSLYDRGLLSKETYMEVVGDFDIDIEVKKREKEIEDDLDVTMYPPIIQNQEGNGTDSREMKNVEAVPTDKKGPEAKNYKSSLDKLIILAIEEEKRL